MKLRALLRNLSYTSIDTYDDLDIKGIACDSKRVREGYLFVAIRGTRFDGHDFIDEAIERGAMAVVSEKALCRQNRPLPSSVHRPISICVSETKKTLATLAANFYDRPSQKIKVIGITGTNGKTTVCHLADRVLAEAGCRAGLIGTIKYRLGDRLLPACNTTPGALELQSLLAEMVTDYLDYALIEVSSHALAQYRVEAIDFDVAVFTNLTQDHLDYHRDMEGYLNAKASLFESLSPESLAVVNIDDPYGQEIIDRTRADVLSYGIDKDAQIRADGLALNRRGAEFSVSTPRGSISIRTRLIGRHNVYNTLATFGVGLSQGIDLEAIKAGVEGLDSVPGRLEPIDCGQCYQVFVDYAHTDDALKNVLTAVRGLTDKKIILVFGCGGDRDRSKRPLMGMVASQLADFVILTSDNPRTEDPGSIVGEIAAGIVPRFKNYLIIQDRLEAIKKALSLAGREDLVIIAGKGHEKYQVFKDMTVPFDDREVVRKILSNSVYSVRD